MRSPSLSKTDSKLNSGIYEGSVRHRRNLPTVHQFDFRFFMLLIDLDEIETLFSRSWFWSTKRWSLCRFRQETHLTKYLDTSDSLKARVLTALRDHGIESEVHSVRLLTQLSYFGVSMNPVSFYYCYGTDGCTVEAIVAEVNNTPWGEQHLYVIPSNRLNFTDTIRSGDIKKDFHVSPFMDLDMNYRMAFSPPGKRLAVKIENHRIQSQESADCDAQEEAPTNRKIIDVTMSLKHQPWSLRNLNRLLWKYPAISLQVVAGIYWNALRLYLKKIPFVPHPKHNQDDEQPVDDETESPQPESKQQEILVS